MWLCKPPFSLPVHNSPLPSMFTYSAVRNSLKVAYCTLEYDFPYSVFTNTCIVSVTHMNFHECWSPLNKALYYYVYTAGHACCYVYSIDSAVSQFL